MAVSTLFQPVRRSNRWLSVLRATGFAATIVAADLLIGRYLSESAEVLLRVLTIAAGMALAPRLVGREGPEPSEADNAATRMDRAAIELETLAIDNRSPAPLGGAAIGQDRHCKETDGEVIPFPAATQTTAGVAYAATELGQYHLFTDILNKEMASVSELSEQAAKSILENLTEIDNQNSVLVNFIEQSGSNEQVAKVVARIETQMKGCQDLLKRFVDKQQANAQNAAEQRSQVVGQTRGVLDLLEKVDGIARQTGCCRSMLRSRPRARANMDEVFRLLAMKFACWPRRCETYRKRCVSALML